MISIHSIWSLIFKLFRKRRFAQFVETIQPKASDRLIDVGGYAQTWTAHPPCVKEVVLVNVHEVEPVAVEGHHFVNVITDGCKLPFANEEFDVVFSNSVIEHVGDWERQLQFAKEARRVGSRLWIQTPAKECFMEPHFLTPFIHWFSRNTRVRLARNFTVWGWITRPSQEECEAMVDDIRLISRQEMAQLFPDCEIFREKFLFFFTKSYIAVRRSDASVR